MALQPDDVDLPPDVCSSSNEELVSEESAVDLPDTTPSDHCCKQQCLQKMPQSLREKVDALKMGLEPLDLPSKNTLWFNQLLNMNKANPAGQFRTQFVWQGSSFCLTAYCHITGCMPKKVRSFLKLIAQGEVLAPQDGRKNPLKRVEPKREDVEAFFVFIYQHLAEPLAMVNTEAQEGEELDDTSIVDGPDWVQSDNDLLQVLSSAFPVEGQKPKVQKRWLPTMTSAELFDLYKDMHQSHKDQASMATFKRVWTKWQAVLGIRAVTQHSRCDDCAKYSDPGNIQFILFVS